MSNQPQDKDENDGGLPAGFEKAVGSWLGAIEDTMEGKGPWNGYIEEFNLIDPTDGTEYTHQNGSLQGRVGRSVGILVESGDVPDEVPFNPKGWIIEYTDSDDDRHVRGTVVGYDSIADSQNRVHHTLHFVPSPSSDPDRS